MGDLTIAGQARKQMREVRQDSTMQALCALAQARINGGGW